MVSSRFSPSEKMSEAHLGLMAQPHALNQQGKPNIRHNGFLTYLEILIKLFFRHV